MFKKEIRDTLKSSLTALFIFASVMVFTYVGIQAGSTYVVPFVELVCFSIETALLVIALFLGSGIFAEEKTTDSFEYLFSLKFTRMQIWLYKMAPRFIALILFFILYLLLLGIFPGHAFPLESVFIPLYFSIFLFSASLSLIYRDNSLTIIYNFMGFGFLLGITAVIISLLLGSFRYSPGDYWASTLRIPIIIVSGISILLFIVFSTGFRKIDINNMSSLLKRQIARLALIPLVVLIIFIMINLSDAPENPAAYTTKDVPGATFDKTNGFYRVWTLSEPPGVDIESDEVIDKYRRLSDPRFDNIENIRKFDHGAYRVGIKEYLQKISIHWPPRGGGRDNQLLSLKETIEKAKTDGAFLLERYQKLLESKVFEDFTAFYMASHLPNLLAWLKVSRLYMAGKALEALEGNWLPAVDDLVRHVEFYKKVARGSRVLINSLIGKAIMRDTLFTLAFLMNRQECPPEVFHRVLNGLSPLTYEEYGNRTSFIGEYLMWDNFLKEEIYTEYDGKPAHLLIVLFLQKNRTQKYIFDVISKYVEYDAIPPYQWQDDLVENIKNKDKALVSGWFWWIRNPVGKIIYINISLPSFASAVEKSYYLKTVYDMTRIAAEMHLKHVPGKTAEETLENVETYHSLMDPCTGKPYVWNGKRQVLYSFGMDRDDDGGRNKPDITQHSDFVLPVVL
jgi:hypothetical protein